MDDHDDVPDALICSISQYIMNDPVVTMDGHTYERSAIQSWFLNQQKQGVAQPLSPKTGEKLPSFALIPNHNLKMMIEEYHRRKGTKPKPVTAPSSYASGNRRDEFDVGHISPAVEEHGDYDLVRGEIAMCYSSHLKGDQVELTGAMRVARRINHEVPWQSTVAFVQRQLKVTSSEHQVCEFRIDRENNMWGGPVFGLAPRLPSAAIFIEDFIDQECWWIDGQGWLHLPNQRSPELVGWQTSNVHEADRISLYASDSGAFILAVNGRVKFRFVNAELPQQGLHAFVAVCGNCDEISVHVSSVPADCLR